MEVDVAIFWAVEGPMTVRPWARTQSFAGRLAPPIWLHLRGTGLRSVETSLRRATIH